MPQQQLTGWESNTRATAYRQAGRRTDKLVQTDRQMVSTDVTEQVSGLLGLGDVQAAVGLPAHSLHPVEVRAVLVLQDTAHASLERSLFVTLLHPSFSLPPLVPLSLPYALPSFPYFFLSFFLSFFLLSFFTSFCLLLLSSSLSPSHSSLFLFPFLSSVIHHHSSLSSFHSALCET